MELEAWEEGEVVALRNLFLVSRWWSSVVSEAERGLT